MNAEQRNWGHKTLAIGLTNSGLGVWVTVGGRTEVLVPDAAREFGANACAFAELAGKEAARSAEPAVMLARDVDAIRSRNPDIGTDALAKELAALGWQNPAVSGG